ncbi:hypothetical protein BVRB_6g146650 [Beta vulgaris subsp. vulgaris]|nr:hypothetical protein BVRB_6g146650 [Beta vulgaris subsp. vulgaris]
MAPLGKKATYVAPGKIGQSRGQGFKATFLPGGLFKGSPSSGDKILTSNNLTPISTTTMRNVVVVGNASNFAAMSKVSNATGIANASNTTSMSKENQVSNVQASDINEGSTNVAATNEVNPSDASFTKSIDDNISKEYRLQRSIANIDALSKFLDQIDPQGDASTQEEGNMLIDIVY